MSKEHLFEVQGKEGELTVDRKKLSDERKARFTATRFTNAI